MKFIHLEHYFGNDEHSLRLCEEELAEYNRYFDENVRNTLSKKFVTEYFKLNGFHDWIIQSVQNNAGGKDNTACFELYDASANQIKILKYQKVKCFRCNFNTEHYNDLCHDTFGIDEFHKLGDKLFSHEVYCPSGSNYYVEFQKISIE